MLRKRFSAQRAARIVGWTSAAVAWGAVVALRATGLPATTEAEPSSQPPPVPAVATAPSVAPAMPEPPSEGLVVIRVAPTADRRAPTTRTISIGGAPRPEAAAAGPASTAGVAPAPKPAPQAPVAVATAPPRAKSGGS